MIKKLSLALVATAALVPASADAAVRITEFMQTGLGGANREFFELTNLGDSAVNVSGWSYNDSNASDPVSFASLGFASIDAGESVIFTELSAAAFRSFWGLSSSVQVFSYGGNSNLSSDGDQIRIFSSTTQNTSTLIDSVTFGEGVRGQSRNRPVGGDGSVAGSLYLASTAGDSFGSRTVSGGDTGNPGAYPALAQPVPEPASWAMMIAGFGLIGGTLRRRTVKVAFA